MEAFGNILILHPAPIAEAMLATPVAAMLKLNLPSANIPYWGKPELNRLLLELCPSVDDFMEVEHPINFFKMLKTVKSFRPDLFVDLTSTTATTAIDWFVKTRILHYKRQTSVVSAAHIKHVVDNFLDTV